MRNEWYRTKSTKPPRGMQVLARWPDGSKTVVEYGEHDPQPEAWRPVPKPRGELRRIVSRVVVREQHAGKCSWWQIPVTTLKLECGHEKVYRGDSVPKHAATCPVCDQGGNK